MAKRWGFYGRDKEKGRIGETFGSPGFEMLTIRGRRGVGKTELVNQVVDGFPEDHQVFWYTFTKNISLSDLRDEMYETAEAAGFPATGGAAGRAPLRGIFVLLKDLLERGAIVVLDEAQFLMSHDLEGVTWKIKTLAEDLRRDFRRGASGQGTLVLMGSAQQQMEAMFAGDRSALSTALRTTMVLEPWPASTLLAVADRHGWLDRPGRLVTLWTAFGGVPRYWEQFAHTPAADFERWDDDDDWRRAFVRSLMDTLVSDWESHMELWARQELDPDNWRILEYLASARGDKTGIGSIRAALPDMTLDGLEGRLHAMWSGLHIVEATVPVLKERNPENEKRWGRWRITDNQMRFWIHACRKPAGAMLRGGDPDAESGDLMKRLQTLEGFAFEQLMRDGWAEYLRMPGGPGGKVEQGYWTEAKTEIDFMALVPKESCVLLGSCKRSAKNHSPAKDLDDHVGRMLVMPDAARIRGWEQVKLILSPEFPDDLRKKFQDTPWHCVDLRDLAEKLGALSLHEPETVSRPYEDGFDF